MKPAKLILLLVVIGIVFWLTLPKSPNPDWESATIQYIKDGDSLVVLQANQTLELRLVGIDAPEYNQPYGQEAKQFLEARLPVDSLVYFTTEGQKDRYDRWLVTLYTNQSDDFGTSLNAQLVANGLAQVPDYPEDSLNYTELKQLEEIARKNKLGIFQNP